jgi:hypothetical protein
MVRSGNKAALVWLALSVLAACTDGASPGRAETGGHGSKHGSGGSAAESPAGEQAAGGASSELEVASGGVTVDSAQAGQPNASLLSAGNAGTAGSDSRSQAGSAGVAGLDSRSQAGSAGRDNGLLPFPDRSVAVSDRGGCIINPASDLTCWGALSSGAPAARTASFATVSIFYAGQYACALDAGGRGNCWSGISKYTVPLTVPLSQLAVGSNFACAIQSSDRKVACWLTAGTTTSAVLYPPAGEFDFIAAGYFHACGRRSDGNLACWGPDLGSALAVPSGDFEAIGSGQFYGCAIGNAGNACWGGLVAQPPTSHLRAVSVANNYGCGIRDDGSLTCWGSAPVASPPAGSFRALSAATYHACAVRIDGTLACWGELDASRTPPAGLVAR